MKVTEQEMRGLLAGKCIPGDMRVNEDLPAYLVRKFSYLQQKLDALAAENTYIKESVAMHASGFKICPACSHQDECETDDIVWMVKETPANDAYINSVRAEGAIAVRDALVLAEDGADIYETSTLVADQLRAGEVK